MRVLRVADVTMSLRAGYSRALLRSGEELNQLGHEVDYLFREDLLGERWPIPLRRLVVPLAIPWRVHRHTRWSAVDIVEIHEPQAGIYSLIAASRLGRRRFPPCVVNSQGLVEPNWRTTMECRIRGGRKTPLWSRVSVATTLLPQVRLGLRRSAHVAVANEANRSYLVGQLGLPVEKVTVISNGVDASTLALDRIPRDGLRLLYLGAWLERKGIEDLVVAWSQVSGVFPSASLTLAGMRLDPSTLLADFHESCRSSISVIPDLPREEIGSLLSEHDALILPSWFEGMPLVALEAAAAGLAIVATDIPGINDIFRKPDPQLDGAILAPLRDSVALAQAIGRLAAEPELRTKLQEQARRRASELTWRSSAMAFERAYEAALLSSPGGSPALPPLPAPGQARLQRGGHGGERSET